MKVYTYYETIDGNTRSNKDREIQQKLLDAWSKSWSAKGFNPIILTKEDAQGHCHFEKYTKSILEGHRKACGKNLNNYPYWVTAHNEWIAFAHAVEGRALVCDYDVLNRDFSLEDAKEIEEGFIWLDGLCSCMAIGRRGDFDNFCQTIIEQEDFLVQSMKEATEQDPRGRTEFGDQDYLVFLKDVLKASNVCKIPPHQRVKLYDHADKSHLTAPIVHFAHQATGRAKREDPQFNDMTIEEVRMHCINAFMEGL